MKTIYAVALGLGLAAVPAIAWAEGGHGDRHGKMLEKVDTNHDGTITSDEIKAASAERFKRMDKNADGAITAEEAPRLFNDPDANHDGMVTADELSARALDRMKRADANGDGMVTAEEREAMKAKWKAKHDEEHGDQPPPAPPQ